MKRTPALIMFLSRAFFYRKPIRKHSTPCYDLMVRITPKTLPLP